MENHVLTSLKGKTVTIVMQGTEKDTVTKQVKGLVVNLDDYFLKLKIDKPKDDKKQYLFNTVKQESYMKYISIKSIIEIDE